MRFIKLLPVFFFLFIATEAFSQSSAVLKRRKEAISKEIESLKRTRGKIDKGKKLSVSQIILINRQIKLREEKINTINAEVKLLDNQIYDNTAEVRSLQSQLNKLKKDYAKMVQFAYRNQGAYNKLMFIFAAKDFNQAYKRLKYLQQLTAYRQRQAGYIKDTQRGLNRQITTLDRNKKEKSTLLLNQETEKQTLGKDKATQNKVYYSLSRQEKTLKQQLDKKEKEARSLNSAIQAAVRKEILEAQRKAAEKARLAAAKAKAANKKAPAAKPVAKGSAILAASPADAKLSSGFLGSRGRLPKPVQGVVTQGFGQHKYKNITTYNPGINIKTATGAPVYAIFSGQVVNVVYLVNTYTVIIRHGEYFSIYSKLRNASVAKGQKISAKQKVGSVASNQAEGITELQFQIWKGGTPVNPSSWILR